MSEVRDRKCPTTVSHEMARSAEGSKDTNAVQQRERESGRMGGVHQCRRSRRMEVAMDVSEGPKQQRMSPDAMR